MNLPELTGGRAITVYGQNEVVRDLLSARRAVDARLVFGAEAVRLSDIHSDRPRLHVPTAVGTETFVCDYIVGCDGFHGICRQALPTEAIRAYERGFALFSMHSTEVTRLYLQCAPDETLDDWSDDRIWEELRTRLRTDDGWEPASGSILQKGISYRRLILAGDAAHIVPPTGAKGLNLAVADVWRLQVEGVQTEAFAMATSRYPIAPVAYS